jgi:two-component system NtrC family response regulator
MSVIPRILIVDDERDMLTGCSNILAALGNKPVPIAEGNLAIELIKNEEFDLIFCDLLMPDVDGMQIIDNVQKFSPQTPIIIFSAYGTIDRAVAAMQAGAFDFIEKPFDTNRLKIVIEKGLRQRNLIKERNNLLKQLEDKYRFDNIISNSLALGKNLSHVVYMHIVIEKQCRLYQSIAERFRKIYLKQNYLVSKKVHLQMLRTEK